MCCLGRGSQIGLGSLGCTSLSCLQGCCCTFGLGNTGFGVGCRDFGLGCRNFGVECKDFGVECMGFGVGCMGWRLFESLFGVVDLLDSKGIEGNMRCFVGRIEVDIEDIHSLVEEVDNSYCHARTLHKGQDRQAAHRILVAVGFAVVGFATGLELFEALL